MSESMVYQMPIDVAESDIDENGHVNNLSYVKWMLDVAVAHSDWVGSTSLTSECGAMWIVRSHVIDYLRPIHLGDPVCIRTWIPEFGKIRSPRRYEIVFFVCRAMPPKCVLLQTFYKQSVRFFE